MTKAKGTSVAYFFLRSWLSACQSVWLTCFEMNDYRSLRNTSAALTDAQTTGYNGKGEDRNNMLLRLRVESTRGPFEMNDTFTFPFTYIRDIALEVPS